LLAKRYTQGVLRIREQVRFYGCDFAGECIFSSFLGYRRFTGLHDENRIAVQGVGEAVSGVGIVSGVEVMAAINCPVLIAFRLLSLHLRARLS
jgi:hypothetical protein